MPLVVTLMFAVLKKIFLKVVGEKLLVWALFWAAEMITSSTKTPHDDEWYRQIKGLYYAKADKQEG